MRRTPNELDAFARELELLRERLGDGSASGALVEDTLQALQTSVEELRVADEQLRMQHVELEEAHLALERERARLEELFVLAPDPYVVTDGQGLVAEASLSAAQLLGIRAAFLPGKPLAAFVIESDRRSFRTMLVAAARGSVDRTAEVRVRRRDGVVRVVELTTSSLTESGEAGRRLAWQMRDVTERTQSEARLWELNAELEHRVQLRTAQLEAEQTRLRVVLEHLPAGVVLADAEGRISWQNPDAVRLLGKLVSIDDLRGFAVDGGPGQLQTSNWPLSRAVLHGEASLDEQIEIELDGERCIIEAAAAPIFGAGGARIGAVMRVEDVTARERRERAEREFIANAAHELRTPLTSIAAAVEVLQSGAKELPEERDLFIGHIERECERLARLGRALLTLARAEARQEAPRIELVHLRPLLEELASDLQPPEAITVRVECAESAATTSNTDLLRQALWNLASNALRYTQHGEVVLAVEELAGDQVAIAVRDTGPGIPKDVQSRVLERFYRAGREGTDGYGLGLGIAARSAEAVGARLELSSNAAGTIARIVVPAARLLTEVER
jgi:PAS domain S-box-containing protein